MKEEWNLEEDSFNSDYEHFEQPCFEYPSSSTYASPSKKPTSFFVGTSSDHLSANDTAELNCLLLKFFVEFDIPLSAIESPNLKAFLKKLGPEYAKVLPDEETFQTVILDDLYQSSLYQVQSKKIQNYSLLLTQDQSEGEKVINVHVKPAHKPAVLFYKIQSQDGTLDDEKLLGELVDDVETKFHGKVVSIVENCLNPVVVKPELKNFTAKCQEKLIDIVAATASDPQLKTEVKKILKALKYYSHDRNR